LQRAFHEMQRAWADLAPALTDPRTRQPLCHQVRLRVGDASQQVGVGLVVSGPLTARQQGTIVDVIRARVSGVVEIEVTPQPLFPNVGSPQARLHWGYDGVLEGIADQWYRLPVFTRYPTVGDAISTAVRHAVKALELDAATTLLETDAGVGVYTCAVAACAKRVIARTSSAEIHSAWGNATLNDHQNVVFEDRAARTLTGMVRAYPSIQRALVHVRQSTVPLDLLSAAGVERIVLVAFSPVRLADALSAARIGGFDALSVTVIDTHPFTSRAELHAILRATHLT